MRVHGDFLGEFVGRAHARFVREVGDESPQVEHVLVLNNDRARGGRALYTSNSSDYVEFGYREVFTFLLGLDSTEAVFVHNHVRGTGEFSEGDLAFMESVATVAFMLGINTHHVVFGNDFQSGEYTGVSVDRGTRACTLVDRAKVGLFGGVWAPLAQE
jgi:hypothetical protein